MSRIDDLYRTRAYHAVASAWDEPTLLACSGGIDSTALLLLAARARRAGSVAPFLVVHVDHRTRPESKLEQRRVAELCHDLGLPFVGASVNRIPRELPGSREAVLRALRYEAIGRVGCNVGIDRVVTAHTLDDQIETILMRLLSGSSSLAAAGMASEMSLATECAALTIRRPLLETTRGELAEVLGQAGIDGIEDPSNEDDSYRRNAVRHNLVPALQAIDPGFRTALLRSVEHAARDARVVDTLADQCYIASVQFDGKVRLVDRARLNEMGPALSSRVLRRTILEFRPDLGRELSFERVEAVRLASMSSPTGSVIELPGELEARIGRTCIEVQEVT